MNDQLELSEATEQAEEVLLGAILIDSAGDGTGEAIKKVSAIIHPVDFRGCTPTDKPEHWPWRARHYYAMTKCSQPHCVNLINKLTELGLLQEHDINLMAFCVSQVPCSLDYMDYAKAVKDYSMRRQIQYAVENGDIGKINILTQIKYTGGVEGL